MERAGLVWVLGPRTALPTYTGGTVSRGSGPKKLHDKSEEFGEKIPSDSFWDFQFSRKNDFR